MKGPRSLFFTDVLSQLADWLESYAHSLELDVWTSSRVDSAVWNPATSSWRVEITTAPNNEPRMFDVKHLVFATGFSGGVPYMPDVPGKVRASIRVLVYTRLTEP